MSSKSETGQQPSVADEKPEDKKAHEASERSNAPYGKEEHMNEELAKQRESERQPS